MKKNKTIKHITSILSGYAFRTAITTSEDGDISLVQQKDINSNFFVDVGKVSRIDDFGVKNQFFLQSGDIIFSARGKFQSRVLRNYNPRTIASSSVYVLRVVDKNVVPEYLAIYLNSSGGQKKIAESAKGSSMKSLTRSDLGNIVIDIPRLEIQKEVVRIYKNNLKYQDLQQRKMKLTAEVVEEAIKRLIKN